MATRNIIFDSQILNSVQLCGARTYYQFYMHLRTPAMPTPIEEGDLLHKMLEFYNKKIMADNTIIYEDMKWHHLMEEATVFGQLHSTHLSLSPAETSEVMYQFEEFTDHTRYNGFVPLQIEQPFLIKLYDDGDIGIYYTGKIDLVHYHPVHGQDVVTDYKKASRTQEPGPESNQFTGYAYAMREAGIKIVNVYKVGFQKTLKREDRFKQYPLFYSDQQLERWKNNTIWWGKQLMFYEDTETWPENRTSCDKYSGCPYRALTNASSDEARQWIATSQFIVGEKWDPTAVLRKEEETK